MNFRDKLEFLMNTHNMTRAQLSRETGVAYTTIDSILKRNEFEKLKLSVIQSIAKYFDVSLDFLMYDEIIDPAYGKSLIPQQRDLVIELRDVITEELKHFLNTDVAEHTKTLNDDEFIAALSLIVSKIECNKDTHELNIYYFYDSKASSEVKKSENLSLDRQVKASDISHLPQTEQYFIKKYRELDEHGKLAVDSLLEIECSRVRQMEQKLIERERQGKEQAEQCQFMNPINNISTEDPRQLPQYEYPAAAGKGAYAGKGEYELVNVPDEVPMSASFGVKITGKSMEPKILDGAIVWVRQQEDVDDGDICVFTINDEGFCKLKKENRFVSLNPDYDDVEYGDSDTVRISGKVVYIEKPKK